MPPDNSDNPGSRDRAREFALAYSRVFESMTSVTGPSLTRATSIFAAKRPRLWPGMFGSHELWHIFVLAASGCHYVMMYFFVAPLR